MNPEKRIIDPSSLNMDSGEESQSLRPIKFSDFIGQSKLKQNLSVFVDAAKKRGGSLDHIIFYGPPGLGKTTLSQIVAAELGVGLKSASGPAITKAGDLAAILTNLKNNDVLFIDEIHRLSSHVEEVLYSAMEDFFIEIIIGEGVTARSVRVTLPKFTLIGATTRLGLLSKPLKDRFGIPLKLDFYNTDELQTIISKATEKFRIKISKEAATTLAKCSRGTPRIALRLMKRLCDFALHHNADTIDLVNVTAGLKQLGIDEIGLDDMDYKYLRYIALHYDGGPVGIDTIAAGLSEDRGTIEDTVEPFLMQLGLVKRTPKGRQLSSKAFSHLGLKTPNTLQAELAI